MSRTDSAKLTVSRRSFVSAIAAAAVFPTAPFAKTPAILTGAGDFRSLSLINNRTAERLNTVYWIEGEYVPEALDAVSYVMRDWRRNEVLPIDARVVDIIAATHNLLGTSEAFELVSGYRSPQTNAMLRSKSRGVARKSYHTQGMAVDLTLKGRSVRQMARAAQTLGAGGVGRYTRSKFVHVDCGPVRDWGR